MSVVNVSSRNWSFQCSTLPNNTTEQKTKSLKTKICSSHLELSRRFFFDCSLLFNTFDQKIKGLQGFLRGFQGLVNPLRASEESETSKRPCKSLKGLRRVLRRRPQGPIPPSARAVRLIFVQVVAFSACSQTDFCSGGLGAVNVNSIRPLSSVIKPLTRA